MEQDLNADEAAAQAIQEAIWLEEELGDEEVARQLLQNNAGAVPELVRQLLRERRAGIAGGAGGNNAGAGGQGGRVAGDGARGGNNEEEEENDEAVEGGAVDAGVAGEVFDDSGMKITRPVKCPLVSTGIDCIRFGDDEWFRSPLIIHY